MKKSTIIIIVLIILAIVAYLLIISSPNLFLTPYELNYAGDIRHFRANLNEARKTPVYPDESLIKNVLLNPEVYKVHIAFFPHDEENSFYLAAGFEITNKLSIIYRHLLGVNVQTFEDTDGSPCLIFYPDKHVRCFKSVPINSTDELLPSFIEPVILMLGPSKASQTAVTVQGFMIVVEGASFDESDRTYTDLDLAVDKMLLVLMEG